MNTRQVIKRLEIWSGGIILLTLAGLAYAVKKAVQHRKEYKRQFIPNTVEEAKGNIVGTGFSDKKNSE